MRFARVLAGFACLASLVLMTGDGLQSQDKKEPGKTKGQLPAGWTKLELSAAQKESIYKLNSEFREKTDKLREEIKALDTELAKKRAAVLTTDQKKKLAELVGAEPSEPKEKGKNDPKGKTKE